MNPRRSHRRGGATRLTWCGLVLVGLVGNSCVCDDIGLCNLGYTLEFSEEIEGEYELSITSDEPPIPSETYQCPGFSPDDGDENFTFRHHCNPFELAVHPGDLPDEVTITIQLASTPGARFEQVIQMKTKRAEALSDDRCSPRCEYQVGQVDTGALQ